MNSQNKNSLYGSITCMVDNMFNEINKSLYGTLRKVQSCTSRCNLENLPMYHKVSYFHGRKYISGRGTTCTSTIK